MECSEVVVIENRSVVVMYMILQMFFIINRCIA